MAFATITTTAPGDSLAAGGAKINTVIAELNARWPNAYSNYLTRDTTEGRAYVYRSGARAVNDYLGGYYIQGGNAAGTEITYGRCVGQALAVTAGAESSFIFHAGRSAGAEKAYMAYNGTDNALILYGNATEKVRLTSAGNFGIGTSTPTNILHVNGAARIDDSIEIVRTAADGFIDIKSAGSEDYDIRAQQVSNGWGFSTGGDGATAQRLLIDSAGHTKPATDNAYSIGTSALRWSVVYAATGTINTSDERAKTDIAPMTLGLEFVKALAPVQYRRLDGKTIVTTRQKVDEDGKPIFKQKAIGHKPKLDASGNQELTPNPLTGLLEPAWLDEIEYVDLPDMEEVHTVVEGQRTHYGLLAQQVKAALDGAGVEPGAVWTLEDPDDPESRQGLRYDQFIPILIKAVQELSDRVQELEAACGA